MEKGSWSLQAEGTGCEIGAWQVNEVFKRCEKPGNLANGGKREGLGSRRHRAGGREGGGVQV